MGQLLKHEGKKHMVAGVYNGIPGYLDVKTWKAFHQYDSTGEWCSKVFELLLETNLHSSSTGAVPWLVQRAT